MTYPQAIFGGSLAIAAALMIVGLAPSGVAEQQGAAFELGTPMDFSNQLVVAVLNTTSGEIKFCRGVSTLLPECGPWRGEEEVKTK